MKILYLGNKLTKHGYTPTGIDYLGTMLAQRGGFTMLYASDKKNKILRLLDMIGSVVRYRSVDLILIDTYSSSAFYFAWLAGRVAALLRIPFVLILRGGDLPTRAAKNPQLVKGLFERAASVVSVSKYIEEEFRDFFPTVYIPNTIDLDLYTFKRRNTLRPKLLWVRSLHQVYNPQLAIQTAKLLQKSYGDVSLAMVGPDKDNSKATLQHLAVGLGLLDHVVFTGKLSKDAWIKLSEQYDIFINTTNFDNMPVSVTEAMALGMPVVSTSVGGVPFLIKHGVDGMLVPPNDAEAFYRVIVDLIENPEKACILAENARTKVTEFDNDIVLQQWKGLFNEILQRRS